MQAYKKQAAGVAAALEGMCEGDALAMQEALATKGIASIAVDGVQYDIHPAMVSISKKTIKQAGRYGLWSVLLHGYDTHVVAYALCCTALKALDVSLHAFVVAVVMTHPVILSSCHPVLQ